MFEAFEMASPDLILFFIRMPEMDGLEAIKRLKSTEVCKNIPIVFLTDIEDKKSEELAYELGAVGFIKKPYSQLELLSRVKSHLRTDKKIHTGCF